MVDVFRLAEAARREARRSQQFKMVAPWHGRPLSQPGTKVVALCAELGVTRRTLSRHVDPTGQQRPDGQKPRR